MRSTLVSATIVAVVVLFIVAASAVTAQSYVSVWQNEASGFQGTASWYGNVGMIVCPTAILPPATAVTAQYHRVQRDAGDVNVWGANFGVTDWLEVGGTHLDVDPDLLGDDVDFDLSGRGSETIGNVKLGLNVADWLNSCSLPAIAVGAFDVSNELNRSLYVVMSKSFPVNGPCSPVVVLHLGYAGNDLNAGALDGWFGGMEFQATKYGLVQAEWDGNAFNADFRFNVGSRLSLDLGILDSDLGYGATYCAQF